MQRGFVTTRMKRGRALVRDSETTRRTGPSRWGREKGCGASVAAFTAEWRCHYERRDLVRKRVCLCDAVKRVLGS